MLKLFFYLLFPLILYVQQGNAQKQSRPASTGTLSPEESRADSLLRLANTLQEQHQFDSGKIAAAEAARIYERLGESDKAGEAVVMEWSTSALGGLPYLERIPFLERAAGFFNRAGNQYREADCLKELGDLYQITGDLANALRTLKRALLLTEGKGVRDLSGIYDLLGSVYVTLGNTTEGIRFALKAIETAEANGEETLSLCTYHNRAGVDYMEMSENADAAEHFNEALRIAKKFNDGESIISVVYNQVDMRLRNKHPADALGYYRNAVKEFPATHLEKQSLIQCALISIYQQMGLTAESRAMATELEKAVVHTEQDYRMRAVMLRRLITFFVQTGDVNKATFYANVHDTLARKMNTLLIYSNNFYYKFKIDSLNKNYLAAIGNYQAYRNLLDTMSTEQKKKQVNNLNVLYATERKDKDIAALTRESQLQQSNLRQARMTRNITLVALAFFIIITSLLFYGYRLKQRNNAILQQQQREINRKNLALEKLVSEKNWLMKEIHHRVKNNLHMVTGLLNSQTEFLHGHEAKAAILESQQRVQAMSLIHQKLYQSENLSSIDMPSYILELVDYLRNSFDNKLPIRFHLDIAKVDMPLSHSIPIGLILNEAITNSIKYAFPGRSDGEILVMLSESLDGRFMLQVKDNGVGFQQGSDPEKIESLGMTLMKGLSKELGGRLMIDSQQGVTITLDFAVNG